MKKEKQLRVFMYRYQGTHYILCAAHTKEEFGDRIHMGTAINPYTSETRNPEHVALATQWHPGVLVAKVSPSLEWLGVAESDLTHIQDYLK